MSHPHLNISYFQYIPFKKPHLPRHTTCGLTPTRRNLPILYRQTLQTYNSLMATKPNRYIDSDILALPFSVCYKVSDYLSGLRLPLYTDNPLYLVSMFFTTWRPIFADCLFSLRALILPYKTKAGMIYHILRFEWTSVHTRYAVKDMRTFRSTISFYCLIFSDHKDYMDLLNNPLI